MKTYVITTVLKLSDESNGVKPTSTMIKEYLNVKLCTGRVVNEKLFRGSVRFEIEDVRTEVLDVNN